MVVEEIVIPSLEAGKQNNGLKHNRSSVEVRHHNLYNHVLHIILQTSSSLKESACFRDLFRQYLQPLLSVSFKAIPPLPWRNVDYKVGIVGDALRSHAPRRLF